MKAIDGRIAIYLIISLIMSWIKGTPSLKSNFVRLRLLQPPIAERSVRPSLHKSLKLPVWPIWGGVLAQTADWLNFHQISQRILSSVGGRVVPIFLMRSESDLLDVSPFLLLVHHQHSFHPLDPFRFLTKLFLPEGFPAHPHAGFDTVTYTVSGGLRHRDSDALSMSYRDGDVQWMRAGSGIIHEEMWAPSARRRVELFQLWIDLPSSQKNDAPFCHVIPNTSFPLLHLPDQRLSVKVLSGECDVKEGESTVTRGPGSDVAASPVGMYHISCHCHDDEVRVNDSDDITYSFSVEGGNFALFYLRAGELMTSEQEVVLPGDFLLFPCSRENSDSVAIELQARAGAGFDGLLLAGRRLQQPVLSAGSFVDSHEESLVKSVQAFQFIERLQGFWSHRLPDEQWRQLCDKLKVGDVIRRFKGLDKI